jgi:hypothetical protein
MNVVHFSPHFPPNYYLFAAALHQEGANVLGLADQPYERLRPELRDALTEYYRVSDLHQYDELLRALGHFTHQHGRLDWIDSHNEYWLETEAALRTDFNIPGLQASDLDRVKRKSVMKKTFQKADIVVAPGRVVKTLAQARKLVVETGYPLVAKPDIGVGASGTFKIENEVALAAFFNEKPGVDYFFEKFVEGALISYDGLVDRQGKIVFDTMHIFSEGIMETVNEDRDLFYYSPRRIDADLQEAGSKTVAAFDLRARFFHIEFFRLDDNSLVALEVNVRPPGGLTTDMFNYARETDIYQQWARMIVHDTCEVPSEQPYFCGYAARKRDKKYRLAHSEVLQIFGSALVCHSPIDRALRGPLGDYGYIICSPNLETLQLASRQVQETVS